MKVWLKPDSPDEVRVSSGDFSKVFSRSEEPFKVSEEDWRLVLASRGFFTTEEPASPKKGRKGAAAGPETPPERASEPKEV